MENYELAFDGRVDPAGLREALAELGVTGERVLLGADAPDTRIGDPAVLLEQGDPGRGFSTTLVCYAGFVGPLGMSELQLAQFLSPRLGRRCLVDDGTTHPDRWILVATDASFGKVITDEDAAEEGDLRIDHAVAPIAGAPELTVRAEPGWVG
ncbi:hypothetical protein [Kineosporia succinea]|uniref:Uncharacterized protein n=1 Tax=Kineosporia succinea TaxID=84632 RepID=A0ABT9P8B8_9ACTN|nr:hypothetical protein [Kineosporia succinea]MDP9828674.1 hypothetical protein [Kineosporia succinea]